MGLNSVTYVALVRDLRRLEADRRAYTVKHGHAVNANDGNKYLHLPGTKDAVGYMEKVAVNDVVGLSGGVSPEDEIAAWQKAVERESHLMAVAQARYSALAAVCPADVYAEVNRRITDRVRKEIAAAEAKRHEQETEGAAPDQADVPQERTEAQGQGA